MSLLLSDEEEDWEIWMSGVSDEEGRQGMSKDWGSGGTEEPGRPGESRAGKTSGSEMPVCRVGVVEGGYDDFETTVCGRLAQIQPVHVCAGNPIPLSKVSGQVPVAFDYEDGTLRQGDRQSFLPSIDGGRASNRPEASNEPEAIVVDALSLSKELEPGNQRTGKTLLKTDSDSSESSRPSDHCSIGRWRRSIPKSWKKSATPQVDLGYSYDAESAQPSHNSNERH